MSPDCSLDLIANAADKQYMAENNAVTNDEQILNKIHSAVSINDFENKMTLKLDLLQKQVSSLQEDIQTIKAEKKNFMQTRYRSISREPRPQNQHNQNQNNQNRRRSQSFHNPTICYWHTTFKDKSYKCTKPCDYARLNGLKSNPNFQNSGNF